MFRKPLTPVPCLRPLPALSQSQQLQCLQSDILLLTSGIPSASPSPWSILQTFLPPTRPDPFSLCPVPSVPVLSHELLEVRAHTQTTLFALTLANHNKDPSRRSARCREKEGRSLAIVRRPGPSPVQPNRGAITLHCSPKSYSARGAFFHSLSAPASPPHRPTAPCMTAV